MTGRNISIIEAPSTLGLRSRGVEQLPDALLGRGLSERLGARHGGKVAPSPRTFERDPETGIMHAKALAEWSTKLADKVEQVSAAGEFPLILGGDCSILLGALLGLRRHRRSGLLFIDGHADFFQPEAEPEGEAASMDLALATGYGPAALADLEGLGPLVRPGDAVAFAFRDWEDQAEYGSQPLPEDLLAFDLDAVRRIGIVGAAAAAIAHLRRDGGPSEIFIHFDADCLDDAVMPAVDYRTPGGLSADEAATVLRMALRSGTVAGMTVTIYNPVLDEDGRAGDVLTEVLVAALS